MDAPAAELDLTAAFPLRTFIFDYKCLLYLTADDPFTIHRGFPTDDKSRAAQLDEFASSPENPSRLGR